MRQHLLPDGLHVVKLVPPFVNIGKGFRHAGVMLNVMQSCGDQLFPVMAGKRRALHRREENARVHAVAVVIVHRVLAAQANSQLRMIGSQRRPQLAADGRTHARAEAAAIFAAQGRVHAHGQVLCRHAVFIGIEADMVGKAMGEIMGVHRQTIAPKDLQRDNLQIKIVVPHHCVGDGIVIADLRHGQRALPRHPQRSAHGLAQIAAVQLFQIGFIIQGLHPTALLFRKILAFIISVC